jgi:probable rRNA maturation factor
MNLIKIPAIYLSMNVIPLLTRRTLIESYRLIPLLLQRGRMASSISSHCCYTNKRQYIFSAFQTNNNFFRKEHREQRDRTCRGNQQSPYNTPYSYGSTKFFGSKVGSPIDGDILIENEQSNLKDINIDRIRATISKIRQKIGYNTYDVSLFLIDDDEMKETNYETRGMNQPTDILSFPFHEAIRPGKIKQPQFDIPEYYQLGDILIDVPYVMRQSLEDQNLNKKRQKQQQQQQQQLQTEDDIAKNQNDNQNRVVVKKIQNNVNSDEDDDDLEEADDDYDDRGVSGAMKTVYNPEDRINMLLIHGMLHLIGYDHESDDEYETMVTAEEKLLQEIFPKSLE